MNFLENDLEDIICKTPQEELRERGLNIRGKMFRQLRIGNYGIADIVTAERINKIEYSKIQDRTISGIFKILPESFLHITIYELKKGKVDISTILQATRYAKGIQRWFEKRNANYNVVFSLVTIGKSVDATTESIYLTDISKHSDFTLDQFNYNFITQYSYDYEIDGLMFTKETNHDLINEGF